MQRLEQELLSSTGGGDAESDSDSELGFDQDQTRGGGGINDGSDNDDGLDADLYGDLETNIFHRSDQPKYKSQKQLTERVHDLESRLGNAYAEIEQLKLKLKEIRKTHDTVLKNAASLHETAKLQITQKNQVVTQLQRKLQEFYTKGSNPSKEPTKVLDELNSLVAQCLSSLPKFSFSELCQEALQNLQVTKKEDSDTSKSKDEKGRENEWSRRFRHENVSIYIYSHHEPTVHEGATTDIQYLDDMGVGRATSQDLGAAAASTTPSSSGNIPTPVLTVSNNPVTITKSTESTNTLQVPDERNRNKSSGSASSGELPPSPDPSQLDAPTSSASNIPPRSSASEKRRSSDRSRSKDDPPPKDRYRGREKQPPPRKSSGDGDSPRWTQGERRSPHTYSSSDSSDRSHSREGQPPLSSSSRRPVDHHHESRSDRRGRDRDYPRRDERDSGRGRDMRYRDDRHREGR